MKCPDDYAVIMMGGLPGDVISLVRVDEMGYPTVYINDCLTMDARRMALRHELWHFEQGDFENHVTIYDAEARACFASRVRHIPRAYRRFTEEEEIRMDIAGAMLMHRNLVSTDFDLPLDMPEPMYDKNPLPPIHGAPQDGW